MKTKADRKGFCLYCGTESKAPFCNRQCYLGYVRSGGSFSQKEYEKQQRESLTDRIVKRTIYIGANRKVKGALRYDQITPEMIIEKRKRLLERRNRRGKHQTPKQLKYCVICGKELPGRHSKYCSDECIGEKERRRSLALNSEKKELKPRTCKECGITFFPKYGDKRSKFHSDKCRIRFTKRWSGNNFRSKAWYYGVSYQPINIGKVFERDGWRCQICGKLTPKKNRGTRYPNAPEADHRIPMSKGGGHNYDNVQCACRKCNGEKSNKNEAGQLPLFQIKSVA